MNVLIIDDDGKSAAIAARGLTAHGYRCSIAPSGEKGLKLAASAAPDIILLDVELPGISGLEVIRRLRESDNETPIIVASALCEPGDRISGLNLGADDYLAKPFCLDELIARVNAVLRRHVPQTSKRITVRGLSIDLPTRTVICRDRKIDLTSQEYRLLEYLARNAGRILSLKMIHEDVWGLTTPRTTKIVETRICVLRKKLGLTGNDEIIHTVKGFGYVLK